LKGRKQSLMNMKFQSEARSESNAED